MGTSHGIVLIFGEQCFEGRQHFVSMLSHSTLQGYMGMPSIHGSLTYGIISFPQSWNSISSIDQYYMSVLHEVYCSLFLPSIRMTLFPLFAQFLTLFIINFNNNTSQNDKEQR